MSDKDAYKKKMEAQLEIWQAEIDRLKAKAKEKSADSEIEYNEQIDEITEKKQATENRLAEMKDASTDSWSDLKSGLQEAADDLNYAIESAKKRFK